MNKKMEWWQVMTTVLGSLGGFEMIKYLMHRDSRKRSESAKADLEEIKADTDEFHLLREHIEFLQVQLRTKEERFAEQTNLLRKANAEVLELSKKVSMLETERSMKLCERRGCKDRQPQSGY